MNPNAARNERRKNWYIAIYYPAVEDEDSYYDNDVLKHRNKMSVLS